MPHLSGFAKRFALDHIATIDPKYLWRRYVLAIALLVVFIFGSHMVTRQAIEMATADATIINDSGRQRMLSQRVLYFATRSHRGHDPAYIAHLYGSLALLEENHGRLSDMARETPMLVPGYFIADEAGPSLDDMLSDYIADARLVARGTEPAADAAMTRMEAVGPHRLLTLLHEAVGHHEDVAKANSARLAEIQKWSTVAALVTLLLEAMLIFLPAQVSTWRVLESLEGRTRDLEASREEVRRRNRDLTTLRDAAEHDSLHDALTGLANRRFLQRELERRCAIPADGEDGLAVMQIDLDRFKEINDTLGHAAGDFVLEHVAEVLRQSLRGHDFIARVGGDEFVVLARSGSREALARVAGRLVRELNKPVEYAGAPCSFSASIGIEMGRDCRDGEAIDADRVLGNADIALYRAKELGRGRYEFFTEEMRAEVEDSRALAEDLARGIEAGEFFPVYQPQVVAGSRAVHGVEALARWRHPVKGEIAPWVFLPVAERIGMTPAIDAAILTRALDDFAAWDAAGLSVPHLSVNVSARRLADPALLETLEALEIPRGRVSFEVLETVLTDRIGDGLRFTLDALDEKGIEIEVDDFGTGHASLLALMSLRPRRLKIARELVDPIVGSEEHRAVLASVLEIARALDTEVTAEGVETEGHARLLEAMGCHVMQGYHFARPMERDAAAALLVEMSRDGAADAVA